MRVLCLLVSFLWAAAPLAAAEPEPMTGESLAGAPFALTRTVEGKACILVIGFSRASGERVLALENALWSDATLARKYALLTVLQLEGAPGFVLPFIRKGLKKQRPEGRWASVLALRSGRELLEILAGYDARAPDEVYAVILDRQGSILRRIRGQPQSVEMTLRAALP